MVLWYAEGGRSAHEGEEDLAVLKGSLPPDWKGWNPREVARHMVPEGLVVHVELELADGSRWAAQCIDMSLTGVLLEFFPGPLPEISLDAKVLLTLKLNHLVAEKVPCLVRHSQDRRLGLFFPDAATRMVQSQDALSHIVWIIEREALRANTKGAFG